MIQLTPEQQDQLRQRDILRVADSTTQEEYVILRAETFDRLRHLLYDDSEWTTDEQLRLLAESGKRAGWDEPGMEEYDNYEANHAKRCQ